MTGSQRPSAYDVGYNDGQMGRQLWRYILKPEFLEEYDRGFNRARVDALLMGKSVTKTKTEHGEA